MADILPESEVRPSCHLIVDKAPPKGKKIWQISQWGVGVARPYDPAYGTVAWSPLPKLTPEQKARLQALEAAGVDVTKPKGLVTVACNP